jgi:hypothetical protein
MVRAGRRLRGWILRLVLNRPLAVSAGVLLVAPALWLIVHEYRWENAYTDGAGLICGATGVALVMAGLRGRQADWIE